MDVRIELCTAFVLPTGSCRQNISCFCGVFQELTDDLTDFNTSGDNYTYFIFGDLNARTGDHPKYIITTAKDHHFQFPDDVLYQAYSNIEIPFLPLNPNYYEH